MTKYLEIDVEVETFRNDSGPVASVAGYEDPETGEMHTFSGTEEHEAVGLAKLHAMRTYLERHPEDDR